jgi:hypothetical protein
VFPAAVLLALVHGSAAAGGEELNAMVLVLDLEAEGVEAREARLLTGRVARALSELEGYRVVTQADLKDLVELEGERQLAGDCDTDSCLAEIASALGARYLVNGRVGRIGSLLLLQLGLFDAEGAGWLARQEVESQEMGELAARTPDAARALFGVEPPARAQEPAGAAPSLLPTVLVASGATVAVVGAVTTVGMLYGAYELDRQLRAPRGVATAEDSDPGVRLADVCGRWRRRGAHGGRARPRGRGMGDGMTVRAVLMLLAALPLASSSGCLLLGASIPCEQDGDCPVGQGCDLEQGVCAEGVAPPADGGGQPLADGGAPGPDGGPPPADGGNPPADGGLPGVDAGPAGLFPAPRCTAPPGGVVVQPGPFFDQDAPEKREIGNNANTETFNALAAFGEEVIAVGEINSDLLVSGAASDILVESGGADAFVARFTEDGLARWAFAAQNVGDDEVTGVVVDEQGCLYITGTTSGDGIPFPGCPALAQGHGVCGPSSCAASTTGASTARPRPCSPRPPAAASCSPPRSTRARRSSTRAATCRRSSATRTRTRTGRCCASRSAARCCGRSSTAPTAKRSRPATS